VIFAQRLPNDAATETQKKSVEEICRIAAFAARSPASVGRQAFRSHGRLSTHVLDTQ